MTVESSMPSPSSMIQTTLPYVADSLQYAQYLADLPYFTWLDSSTDPKQGRYDILSAAPEQWLEINNSALTQFAQQTDGSYAITHAEKNASADNFFAAVQTLLASTQAQLSNTNASDLPFIGGVLGYFGYNLGNQLYNINNDFSSAPVNVPDACVGLYSWAIVVDHQAKKAWFVALPSCTEKTRQVILQKVNCLGNDKPADAAGVTFSREQFTVGPFNGHLPQEMYLKKLAKVHDYIQAGDCYQVNFTHQFSATFSGSTLAAYSELRKALPSPFSAYIQLGDGAILSVSPERLLELNNNKVEARPIKGTMPRGKTPSEDAANADILRNSEKDQAENLMIVDLLRNDISKVCAPFSVKVPELFSLESYTNVHHLVSCITGELAPHYSAVDLLKACFPGGSITGAPKKRAMEIIRELEVTERSVYCGSIGYLSAHGRMDTNIAIRSVVFDGQEIHCWGGGGIVADSDAEKEFQESLNKIQLIMDTLTASA